MNIILIFFFYIENARKKTFNVNMETDFNHIMTIKYKYLT